MHFCQIKIFQKISLLFLIFIPFLFLGRSVDAACVINKGCVDRNQCELVPGTVGEWDCEACNIDSDCTVDTVPGDGMPLYAPPFYWGTVKVNGENVAGNTPISALICGVMVKTDSTFWYESESHYFTDSGIQSNVRCTTQREGGEPGDQIRFCIGNCYADQTATWQYGGSAELNLSYSGACNPCWAAPPEEPPVCPGPKQMDGDAPQSLSDVWQYAPFTPTYTGEVYFVSIKAGNYGGGARSVTCKVTNAARTADISITASSATFTNLDGAQWREVDFNSNRFSLTAGIQYNVDRKSVV